MRLSGTVLALLLSLAVPSSAPADISVSLDQSTLSTRIGERFSFTATVRNDSPIVRPGVVAHLDVVSLDPQVYVDPEDWSSRRTEFLGTIPAEGTERIEWTVQAVNSGNFVLFVSLTAERGTDRVTTSPALRVTIASQRTLNAGGVLPLALGMPAILLALMVIAAWRRRDGCASDEPPSGRRADPRRDLAGVVLVAHSGHGTSRNVETQVAEPALAGPDSARGSELRYPRRCWGYRLRSLDLLLAHDDQPARAGHRVPGVRRRALLDQDGDRSVTSVVHFRISDRENAARSQAVVRPLAKAETQRENPEGWRRLLHRRDCLR